MFYVARYHGTIVNRLTWKLDDHLPSLCSCHIALKHARLPHHAVDFMHGYIAEAKGASHGPVNSRAPMPVVMAPVKLSERCLPSGGARATPRPLFDWVRHCAPLRPWQYIASNGTPCSSPTILSLHRAQITKHEWCGG